MHYRETLPEDRIDWLRDEILGWMIRLSNGPIFVTTKLCLAVSLPCSFPNIICSN